MSLPFSGTLVITDTNGVPINGAKVYTYEAGTLSPKAVYTTPALSVAHPNPIIAAGGRATFFLGDGSYRIRVTDAADVELPAYSVDNVSADTVEASELAASGGSALVGFVQSGTGAVPRTVQDKLRGWVDGGDQAIVGNGVTNDSAALQSLIDANKGKRIHILGGTLLIGGVTMIGPSYDGTQIVMAPGAKFKLAPDGGASTFGGAWVGLLIKDCAGVQLIDVNWDGNRSAMTSTREQIFCVGVAGASDYLISGGQYTEIQGDGVYVGQSNWTANSTAPVRGRITGVRGRNATASGRNLITVISADDLEIDSIDSRLIGGVIGVTTMPAGICVEPDLGYQVVNNVRIRDCFVVSAGTSGVCILGKSVSGSDAAEDWSATNCSVKNVTVRMVTGAVAGPAFTRVAGLDLDIEVVRESGTRRKLCVVDGAQRVYGRVVARGGSVNVAVGEALRVRDFDIEVQAYDYETAGLLSGDVDFGRFTGSIYGAINNINSFAIQLADSGRTITQTAVTYSVDARADGNNLRAVRRESGGGSLTFVNTRLANCDFSGYASIATTIDAVIPAHNVIGLTDTAPAQSFASLDTTPSVGIPARFFACANAGPTSITTFDDGYDGREFVLRMDSNTTLVHNASFMRLKGAVNVSGRNADDHIVFRRISGIWFEQSRSW